MVQELLRGPVLSALRQTQDPRWRAAVRAALAFAGNVPNAARLLDRSEATLRRWMSEDPTLAPAQPLRKRGRPTKSAR